MDKGLITSLYDWSAHPSYSTGTALQWTAGLVIVLILAFLWSTVIRLVKEA